MYTSCPDHVHTCTHTHAHIQHHSEPLHLKTSLVKVQFAMRRLTMSHTKCPNQPTNQSTWVYIYTYISEQCLCHWSISGCLHFHSPSVSPLGSASLWWWQSAASVREGEERCIRDPFLCTSSGPGPYTWHDRCQPSHKTVSVWWMWGLERGIGNDCIALLWPRTASFAATGVFTESTSGWCTCIVCCAYLSSQGNRLASRELGHKSYMVSLRYLCPEEDRSIMFELLSGFYIYVQAGIRTVYPTYLS